MRIQNFLFVILISCLLIITPHSLLSSENTERGSVTGKSNIKVDIREPAVAGTFYPDNPEVLSNQVKEFLKAVPAKKINGEIVALISPHAGYLYSGQVAAHAYKLLADNPFHTVIIIGPSHHVRFQGSSVYAQGVFRTPLGLIPIDEEICRKIIHKNSAISFYPQAHAQEHSLEVQLPFLQTVLKDFKIVPIVMGDQNLENCTTLSDAIYQAIKGKKVLIIASTDLSHYYPYDEAVKLDTVLIDHVKDFDAQRLAGDLSEGKCEACGRGPLITTLLLARKMGANKSVILQYANSGDVTGDKGRVVGYLAAALCREQKSDPVKSTGKAGTDLGLNAEEKKILHHIARSSIEGRLTGEAPPNLAPPSDRLQEKRGVFVTLKRQGRLRGCIGYIRPYKPLYQAVSEMALAAAFQDRRFSPLKKEELKDLEIEISVLTENSWDPETFLEHTCLKAGLDKDAWKDQSTELYIFSAEIF
ncbi:MAG: AmmeMemoRadiSam system protein B [Nitrospirae bacterium]|nr:AmmeMemoRadiSam system protein B [Nitrospirota bacterium]